MLKTLIYPFVDWRNFFWLYSRDASYKPKKIFSGFESQLLGNLGKKEIKI